MRYYFVDYENVDVSGFEGLTDLCETDVVYIYYSENHNRMTFGLHGRIMKSKAKFEYRKIANLSKESLDTELTRALEHILVQNEKLPGSNAYYIISKDKGYAACIQRCKERGAQIEMCSDIQEALLPKEERLRREREQLEVEIAKIKLEKEELQREKKSLQAELNTMKKQSTLNNNRAKSALQAAGMTKKELKAVEPFLNELLAEKDRTARNILLNRLLPGTKHKPYLDALEKM